MIEIKKNELKKLFQNHPAVGLFYLFGSRAKETAGILSDYDFAVYLDELDIKKRGDLRFELIAELSQILGTDKIDLHVLNDIQSPELKYAIIYDGKLIFEREPYRVLVEPRILTEYFDFRFLLEKHGLTKTKS